MESIITIIMLKWFSFYLKIVCLAVIEVKPKEEKLSLKKISESY